MCLLNCQYVLVDTLSGYICRVILSFIHSYNVRQVFLLYTSIEWFSIIGFMLYTIFTINIQAEQNTMKLNIVLGLIESRQT